MTWLREIVFKYRHFKACRALQRDRDRRANSFEVQDFKRRRDAARRGRLKPT